MIFPYGDEIFEKKLEILNLLLLLKVVFHYRWVWLGFPIFSRIRGQKRIFERCRSGDERKFAKEE